MDSGGIINRTKTEVFLGSQMLRNLAQYASRSFPWQEEIPVSGNPFFPGRNYISREPIGVTVGIVPWNFPLTMALWKIGQAIVMGNTVILKPASNTPLSALVLAEAISESPIPKGVVNIITGPGGSLGKTLVTHPDVDKIAFTGSTAVGKTIMAQAAQGVKKTTLELGGKSANIILDDADLDLAVDGVLFGTFFHTGQICESGTRILVHDAVYDQVIAKLKKRVSEVNIAYQLDPESQMGPLVSAEQRAVTESYVQMGLEKGFNLLCGGERPQGFMFQQGFYYKPTIFTDVDNKSRLAQEEIFGPLACVIRFENDEQAALLANDSIYGLAGGIWTKDMKRAQLLAREIKTGTMWINDYHAFGDYCPFGGYKESGIGRELGQEGLAEYTQTKRIHISSEGNQENKLGFQMMFSYPKSKSFQYIGPTKLNAGQGAVSSLNTEVSLLGCQKAFVISDKGVKKAGILKQVEKALGDFWAGSFTDVPTDSSFETVDKAARTARLAGADVIVSLGGGSVIDTAKVVCVVLEHGGKATDHIAINRLTSAGAPHLAIPTTSGTGSEVTNVAVIKNQKVHRKVYLADNHLFPQTAILDPDFTLSLPSKLTASTAMDALTHAAEAMMSLKSNPVCDGQALAAISLISQNLPLVMKNPKEKQARLKLQIAASMAGWAFSIAQVALAHALAHTIGALHGIPHGTACGVFLPAVMRFNALHADAPLKAIARALGAKVKGLETGQAGEKAADKVQELMKVCGHPTKLSQLNLPQEALYDCALHAVADPVCIFNPRPVTDPGVVMELLENIY
jgi:acyl-CoA reductase-like NAD-dependent aldehyde dehydrogenase/alcohol dehydrogenase class IV